MYTINFWKDAAERAVKTGAQSLILFWFADTTGLTDALGLDWLGGLGIFLAGVLLSLLTSIVSAPVSTKGTASMTSEVAYKE
jgi:hypothetical protein